MQELAFLTSPGSRGTQLAKAKHPSWLLGVPLPWALTPPLVPLISASKGSIQKTTRSWVRKKKHTLSFSFSPPALIFSLPVANPVVSFCFPLFSFSRMFGMVVMFGVDLGSGNVWEIFLVLVLSLTQLLTSRFSAASVSTKTSRYLKYEVRDECLWGTGGQVIHSSFLLNCWTVYFYQVNDNIHQMPFFEFHTSTDDFFTANLYKIWFIDHTVLTIGWHQRSLIRQFTRILNIASSFNFSWVSLLVPYLNWKGQRKSCFQNFKEYILPHTKPCFGDV